MTWTKTEANTFTLSKTFVKYKVFWEYLMIHIRTIIKVKFLPVRKNNAQQIWVLHFVCWCHLQRKGTHLELPPPSGSEVPALGIMGPIPQSQGWNKEGPEGAYDCVCNLLRYIWDLQQLIVVNCKFQEVTDILY